MRVLRNTVHLPADRFTELWQPASFEAWLETASALKRLQGVLMRVGPQDGTADGLRAFCAICPHEICHVEVARETSDLPMDTGPPPAHPVFVCPCHFSIFDPLEDGRAISGPALRGLYRFEFQLVDGTVEIDRVEADVEAIFS